jgi:hypothetical protein
LGNSQTQIKLAANGFENICWASQKLKCKIKWYPKMPLREEEVGEVGKGGRSLNENPWASSFICLT